MKLFAIRRATASLMTLIFLSSLAMAADRVELRLEPKGVLQVHGEIKLPFSSSRANYTIESSLNLMDWTPVGLVSGSVGLGDEILRKTVEVSGEQTYFRVSSQVDVGTPARGDGDAVFGYAEEFSKELRKLGQLPLGDFKAMYSLTNEYLAGISFDPTQAQYFGTFNSKFHFNAGELGIFKTNGFVVSPRLGSYSFADAFYNIYFADLPVFVSTDAILQAWHRTFTVLLEEIEETILADRLWEIINGMSAQIPALYAEAQGTPLQDGVRHADHYLAVAKSLLEGTATYGHLGQSKSISQALGFIQGLQPRVVNLYGSDRTIDFSQFTVRGHYEISPLMGRYFRTMMWLGIVDLRIIDRQPGLILGPVIVKEPGWEFAGATALNILLDRSNQRGNWESIEAVVEHFFGPGDALNFSQLNDVMAAANVAAPYNGLQPAYENILAGNLGVQNIRSGYFKSPFSAEQLKLPRSFAFLSQRFTFDSWAQGKVVFDDIIWDEDGIPSIGDKVLRRVPSALDVAFSVLGNSVVVPEITERIAHASHPFRDGFRYQHNLAAARNVLDSQDSVVWTNSIYSSWLTTLRALSAPTTDPKFPQAMRTRAWALKTLNTQLASWTQLRHDTVLYVKQSYTPLQGCSYPKAFVEPRVEFWGSLRQMALRTRDLIGRFPTDGIFFNDGSLIYQSALRANQLATLNHFCEVAQRLKEISEKELAEIELDEEEITFLEDLVERKSQYGSGNRLYSGWYPRLFLRSYRQQFPYGPNQGSDFWDALVTDVHTAIPDQAYGFPGSILHQAVGNVHMAFMAVDCADGSLNMFAGPVLSHYEFETGSTVRKTDTQWKTEIKAGSLPASPEWTKSYLAPGAYQVPAEISVVPTNP